jgi:hypothetical protein
MYYTVPKVFLPCYWNFVNSCAAFSYGIDFRVGAWQAFAELVEMPGFPDNLALASQVQPPLGRGVSKDE